MFTKSKKNTISPLFILFFVSLNLFTSCKPTAYQNTNLKITNISIDSSIPKNQELLDYIAPYKNHIDEDLNKVISYAPETMDKNVGKWETTIGNLFAEATLEECNAVFEKRYQRKIDGCILNHGGIRAVISKGDVTKRTAYEVMPFENSAIVLELSGVQIKQMANYIIASNKPHPLANILIEINADKNIENIFINNEKVEDNQHYLIVTNDYLAQGGDGMFFLKEASKSIDLDYKLRNILIQYFSTHNNLPVIKTKRIIEI